MKILYITSYESIRQAGGYINDYMNDLLFYGLWELKQEGIITELVDSTPIMHLYKDNKAFIPEQILWGKGFSQTYLIPGAGGDVDRTDLVRKIVGQYFDVIIFGAWNRYQKYRDIVEESFNGKVIVVDGADDTMIRPAPSRWLKFKRELMPDVEGQLPISFAIPECKFLEPNYNKAQDFGTVIPGDESTYIFTDEKTYYEDYNRSYYGVNRKKAGWDSMRMYEIISSYCMPFIPDLDTFPNTVMTNYPKDLVKLGMSLTDTLINRHYYSVMDETFKYAKQHLTTKALSKYVLSFI